MAKISPESAMDDDAQNELKRRARRRLVGATALALAAVIVLPMVMDHEPRVPAQEIQVRIPSQDGGIVSRILPGKGTTALPPLADSQQAAERSAPPRPETKPDIKAEPVAAPKPEAKPEAKAEPKPEGKTEAKPEAKAEPKTAAPAKVEPKPVAAKPAEPKKDESARAAAALGGQGAAAEQWVVQLGAYKEEGNVKLLVKKLKELGVPSYTESFNSPQGARTRVRAGPFATKEAAEKAQARAKAIGVSGPVAPK
jgi:DedD protein